MPPRPWAPADPARTLEKSAATMMQKLLVMGRENTMRAGTFPSLSPSFASSDEGGGHDALRASGGD